MADMTGPDPLSPAERRAVLREHLEREKQRRRAAEAKLAEVRETIATFLPHYGNSELPSFKVALDLAHGVQQVLDRKGPDDD